MSDNLLTIYYDFYITNLEKNDTETTLCKKTIYSGTTKITIENKETYADLARRIYKLLRQGQLSSYQQKHSQLACLKYFCEAQNNHEQVKPEKAFIAVGLSANVCKWEKRVLKSAYK